MASSEQQANVYCVKYALTTGIFRVSGRIDSNQCFYEAKPLGGNRIFPLILSRNEYSVTEEGAQELFLKLRDSKITSLHRQLAKFQNMAPKFVDNTPTETTND
jgi:hypothetical protein